MHDSVKKPKLSVIIVHYRTPELLRLCLKRLDEHLKGIDYEVNVIDNSKNNIGFARGVNAGLRSTTGQYRLILNPDTMITEGSVQKMLAYMDKHEDIGIMGPQLLYFNGEHQRSYHRLYRPMTILARRSFLGRIFKNVIDDFMMNDTDPNKIQTPDWILGAAMLVRGNALERVGLMDEQYFLYFEDVDWCRRFWHNGYMVVYYPQAIFYHYYPRTSTSWNKTTLWHIASAMKFFKKWSRKNISLPSSSSYVSP
ncbi:MAG: glycosyltransferase family 2 protein [Patescibacteria group bacterium]|mgnify:CR=1 FL=1